ncbi:MAG: 30S ribosome-binding factor RbfA [Candidatus Omnitrophica bacterium]|nr:30S ribosome-binding factor RbfA [Candidatus Omnitrophota bacterium]
MGVRPERAQEAIRQEISIIINNELKDPRLGFITVTGVELTKDMRYAKVYFSVLGEDKAKFLALKGLKSAKGYIKGRLGDKIKLRFMPEIEFKIDETLERTEEVFRILDKLNKEKGKKTDEASDGSDKEA